jgi:phytoene dehydrogenase-like protein
MNPSEHMQSQNMQSEQTSATHHYDAIVIGSGLGGLTVASLLAQLRGRRVLVLERHFKPGGFTHGFKRQGFYWDVGVHYVGQMDRRSPLRQVFDLITGNGVDWQKMPEPFEKFVYPNLQMDWYGDRQRLIQDLGDRFPEEKAAIQQYFRDIPKAATALSVHTLKLNSNWLIQQIARLVQWFNGFDLALTTQDYLDQHFTNPELKALLVSQWGTYGLPPAQSPFAVHATVFQHYLTGGYYPMGGAGQIAPKVKAIVEAQGGKIQLNREVTQVLIEGNRAVGVRVQVVDNNLKPKVSEQSEPQPGPMTEDYFAPLVISDVGVATTYLKLIPQNYPIPFRESLRQFLADHPPATCVTLYLGLSDDPRSLGFQGENHWIYQSCDHDDLYAQCLSWDGESEPPQCYLSFPSLKDPKAEKHTAEIITWAGYDQFRRWREQPWLHRDEDYQALKERMSQGMLALVDRHYPGFANLVAYHELATPLTNEHFSGHSAGSIYGLSAVPERFQPAHADWMKAQTPVPGLYITGVDLYMGGIAPAILGGITTLSQIPNGLSFPYVFSIAATRAKQRQ